MLQLGAELWASISDCNEPFWEYADWTSLWISGLYRSGLLWVPEWWTWEWEQRHTVHSSRKGQPLLCFQTNNWVWRLAEHWPQPCDARMLSQTQTCLLAHRNALFNHVLNKGSDSTQLVPCEGCCTDGHLEQDHFGTRLDCFVANNESILGCRKKFRLYYLSESM